MTARELMSWLDEREPATGSEEGFKIGDPEAPVSGALVCWMATVPALRQAAAESCNLVICHESLFYPESAPLDHERCWRTNRVRMELMSDARITVYRAHGKLDRLCIFDDFASALGLRDACAGEGYSRIFPIPPTSLRDLADRAKRAIGLPSVRVVGDPEGHVARIGLPWGGLGLFVNVRFMQQLVDNGADALIAGETDEYAMRFAEDAGMALIETSHAASENIGLRHFAAMLADAHPGLRVVFHDSGTAWRVV